MNKCCTVLYACTYNHFVIRMHEGHKELKAVRLLQQFPFEEVLFIWAKALKLANVNEHSVRENLCF